MEPKQFLEECWTVIRAKGKDNPEAARRAQFGWGLKAQGARVFRDKQIEIVAEAEPSKRILVTNLAFRNPVVCTDSDGKPFRWHGEYVHLASHVHALAVGTQPDE